MSKALSARIAEAIAGLDAHCQLHGRDMYGETAGLHAARDVLSECAAALAAQPEGKHAAPEERAPEPKAEPVKVRPAARGHGGTGA